ncbi:MAG: hypothetical protein M1828_004573 [Chrysothrix sp. TS-e1954]|nr:MAG: hypothetical protein M1828_004573 [Chrysothrix sp. TS-e1954]
MPPAIVNATVQSAVLSATSNILAQVLESYRTSKPYSIDTKPLSTFVIFTALNTPPNFLWQGFLESSFPGYTLQSKVTKHRPYSEKAIDVAHEADGEYKEGQLDKRKQVNPGEAKDRWTEDVSMERRLDKKNTAIKFGLDQTFGALVNTVIFLSYMAAVNGADMQGVKQAVLERTWPLMSAGYKFWPLISLLSFTVVPVQQRLLFGGMVGVVWGIFLSLFAKH